MKRRSRNQLIHIPILHQFIVQRQPAVDSERMRSEFIQRSSGSISTSAPVCSDISSIATARARRAPSSKAGGKNRGKVFNFVGEEPAFEIDLAIASAPAAHGADPRLRGAANSALGRDSARAKTDPYSITVRLPIFSRAQQTATQFLLDGPVRYVKRARRIANRNKKGIRFAGQFNLRVGRTANGHCALLR